MKVLIAAGGTGGHINPGIAIGKMLKERGYDVIFVGTEIGMEKDLVPKAGFELKMVHSEGLHRGFSLKNFKTIMEMNRRSDRMHSTNSKRKTGDCNWNRWVCDSTFNDSRIKIKDSNFDS